MALVVNMWWCWCAQLPENDVPPLRSKHLLLALGPDCLPVNLSACLFLKVKCVCTSRLKTKFPQHLLSTFGKSSGISFVVRKVRYFARRYLKPPATNSWASSSWWGCRLVVIINRSRFPRFSSKNWSNASGTLREREINASFLQKKYTKTQGYRIKCDDKAINVGHFRQTHFFPQIIWAITNWPIFYVLVKREQWNRSFPSSTEITQSSGSYCCFLQTS